MCDTNGIGDLDKHTVAESASNQRLGDPPGSISCTAVDLSWVFSGEGSATMGAPSSVCVNDDLASGEAGVAMWATTGEASTRVEMVDGVLVEVLGWDDLADDLFLQLSLEFLLGDVWAVLGRDQHGVDTEWGEFSVLVFVLNGNLGLSVGANVWAGAVLTNLSELEAELGCERVGKRHKVFAFVGSIAEHVTLITGSYVFGVFGDVDGVGNFWRLLF